ncbi:helix-turn-helix domain-containing protein [Companilactobacillus futsaii]|uniref:XRE family transcriptional regulator n=2 Tax=Companilactobacillus futsaii TaxID=938155 RepID=A0A5B7T241_9LACO|nr:XRE family transcriptional regulator [Companilactobacillus futsaii]KRK90926.1 transcriptional regulator, XRE family [Companilactobacillus futsaii JCM 17355]QCX24345.1 XRE family transcriptional regulator [Companilactobacillus futsaii]
MFGERLKKLRKSRNFSQDKLADELNKKYDKKISKSMISRWENGKNDIQMEMVHIIADYFNVNPVRLINPVITDSVATLPRNLVEEKSSKNIQVPILGEIACGDPITAEENIEGYLEEPEDSLPSGTVFYLVAKGHSMEPTIPNGSNVLIREQPEVEDDEIAAVLVNSDTEATLKRVKHQGNMIMLMPDNKDYSPIIITSDNPVRILGKAIRYTTNL